MQNVSRPFGLFSPAVVASFVAIRRHGIGFVPDTVDLQSYQTAVGILETNSGDSRRSYPRIPHVAPTREFGNFRYFGPTRPALAPVAPVAPLAGRSFAVEITNVETAVTRIAEFLAGRRS
jgi:hypothetical protein